MRLNAKATSLAEMEVTVRVTTDFDIVPSASE